MSKYSFEFKKKVVNAYVNGEGGYPYLSKTYGIPSHIKLATLERCTARREEVVATQPARAQRLRRDAIFFIRRKL